MSWTVLEHTADLGIVVQAASLEELFADAAAGLCDTITERSAVLLRHQQECELVSPQLDLLMVDWLDELLFLVDSRGDLVGDAAVTLEGDEEEGWRLRAVLRGEPSDAARHPQKVQVKAITYHGLEVARESNGAWRAQVIFDI
jgi:SHS2 domain-containing protein